MKAVRVVALLLVILVLLGLGALWLPVTPHFASHPQPTHDYAEAITRLADLQAQDTPEILPECHTTLLTHQARTHDVIVFLHGVPNCPAQFATIAQQFYDLGYNVLIPRLPHYGLADRVTPEIGKLTAGELAAATDGAVDIATGLGERVTVAGFSTGGAMAAWAAQERADVDKAVLMSPFLSPGAYPAWLVRPIMRLLLILPNQFWWWNEELREQLPGPPYAYPHYSSHAMAQIMRLSFDVRNQAQTQPAQSHTIALILNPGPRENVDNEVARQLLAAWQRNGATVTIFALPDSLDLEHAYLDPAMPNQPVDVVTEVYPLLIEQIR